MWALDKPKVNALVSFNIVQMVGHLQPSQLSNRAGLVNSPAPFAATPVTLPVQAAGVQECFAGEAYRWKSVLIILTGTILNDT